MTRLTFTFKTTELEKLREKITKNHFNKERRIVLFTPRIGEYGIAGYCASDPFDTAKMTINSYNSLSFLFRGMVCSEHTNMKDRERFDKEIFLTKTNLEKLFSACDKFERHDDKNYLNKMLVSEWIHFSTFLRLSSKDAVKERKILFCLAFTSQLKAIK